MNEYPDYSEVATKADLDFPPAGPHTVPIPRAVWEALASVPAPAVAHYAPRTGAIAAHASGAACSQCTPTDAEPLSPE